MYISVNEMCEDDFLYKGSGNVVYANSCTEEVLYRDQK